LRVAFNLVTISFLTIKRALYSNYSDLTFSFSVQRLLTGTIIFHFPSLEKLRSANIVESTG